MTITIQNDDMCTVLFKVGELSVHKDELGYYITTGIRQSDEGTEVFIESSKHPPVIKA